MQGGKTKKMHVRQKSLNRENSSGQGGVLVIEKCGAGVWTVAGPGFPWVLDKKSSA